MAHLDGHRDPPWPGVLTRRCWPVSAVWSGKLYHIGIGHTYAGTCVLLLVQDLDIRNLNAATGELLRELTLDPTRNYQPTGRPPGPKPKRPRT